VVIAAASQFHGKYDTGLTGEGAPTEMTPKYMGEYTGFLKKRMAADGTDVSSMDGDAVVAASMNLPVQDRQLAAMLVNRDSGALAGSLENLTGPGVAQFVFGIGVIGMAVSTIIILMLINGFTLCEAMGVEPKGVIHRIGSYLPGVTGSLGFLFLWSNASAKFYLAVPTSVFGMVLLPIAYVTFFMMMNNKALLGDNILKGNKRIAMNIGMGVAIAAAGTGSLYAIYSKGPVAMGAFGIFVAAVVVAQFMKKK